MRLSLFLLYLTCLIFGSQHTAHAGVMPVRDNTVYNHKPSHSDQTRIFFHNDSRVSPLTTISTYNAPEVLAEEREDEDHTDQLYKQVKPAYSLQAYYLPQIFTDRSDSEICISPALSFATDRYLLIRVLRI